MASLRKLGVDQVQLQGKKVLMRIDLNVGMRNGLITNLRRLNEGIPTIRYALEKGAAIILISHIGRPGGRFVPELSLKPFAELISKKIHCPVEFLPDCIGRDVAERCRQLKPGEVVLLENLRFHAEEMGENVSFDAVLGFRAFLSSLADIYVQDAFGTAHRSHSSNIGIQIPIRAAGLLMMKELDSFSVALESPQRPLLAIIGGASLIQKKDVIRHLLTRVDSMVIAGAPAFTFKKFLNGVSIGSSAVAEEEENFVKEVETTAALHGVRLYFPLDYVIADKFSFEAVVDYADDSTGIPQGMMALDIGQRSRILFRSLVEEASTILWNGPVGVYEFGKFSVGTKHLMDSLIDRATSGATVVVCGTHTCQACKIWGTEEKFTHISTGDTVSTLLLSGQPLPGVESLSPHPLSPRFTASDAQNHIFLHRDGGGERVYVEENVKEKVKKWREQMVKKTGSFKFYVAVDVGGTHTRVVIGVSENLKFLTVTKFQASCVSSLLEGFREVAKQLLPCLGGIQAFGAAIAIAGQVFKDGTRVEMTWYATPRSLKGEQVTIGVADLPALLFPPTRTRFLNDLEAACYGIMKLSQDSQISEYFTSILDINGTTTPSPSPHSPSPFSTPSPSPTPSSSPSSSSPSSSSFSLPPSPLSSFSERSSSPSSSPPSCSSSCSSSSSSPRSSPSHPPSRSSSSSCSSSFSSSSSSSSPFSVLSPYKNYLVCWVGTGLGSGVIRYVNGDMKEVVPLEAGHMSVTPVGLEDHSKSFDDGITTYLSHRLYSGNNPIEWEDVCCGRGLANCFAAIEHHKTGRDMPMVGVHSAGKVAGRALTAQRTMEHQKRRYSYNNTNTTNKTTKTTPPTTPFTTSNNNNSNNNNSDNSKEEKKEKKDENPEEKPTKMIVEAMRRIRAKLPGPMKYAHDSLKTHYRYLVRFSQQLSITFRVDAVFWVGDNQVYNQNFVAALAEDLITEYRDHPKASWMEGVSIYTQTKSVNISLLGVLFCAHQIAKEAQIAENFRKFMGIYDDEEEEEEREKRKEKGKREREEGEGEGGGKRRRMAVSS